MNAAVFNVTWLRGLTLIAAFSAALCAELALADSAGLSGPPPTRGEISPPFDPIRDANFFDPAQHQAPQPAALTLPIVTSSGQPTPNSNHPPDGSQEPASITETPTTWNVQQWLAPGRFRGSASTFVFLGAVSLAPAILLMTTSFVRLSIVFSLLRQAIGAQILPSNQILTTLAMFLTMCIMWPTWSKVYEEAIVPYTEGTQRISASEAWQRGIGPIRGFMSQQIELAGNSDNVVVFYETLPDLSNEVPESYDDVPLRVLLPAYLLSELKVAFLLGFQIYLPFLVIDVLVSAVTASMGMLMLPPLSISLPLKLIVFVLVDGWSLLAGTLMTSFVLPGG